MRCWMILCLFWMGLATSPSHANASEKRFAFLIANQNGWHGEPTLDYVLSGDVRPLANSLKGLGFQVEIAENKDATSLRQIFKKVLAHLNKHPEIQTFLFYYSGHADQTYFHLGPKGKHPLNYQEFGRFFAKLSPKRKIAIFDSCYSGEIIRRFGSLKRYKHLLKRGKTKGIRAQRKLDLHRLVTPQQGQEQGIRIIASSLGVSWELREYKASVFTHHLLRGLKGPADINHDGKITVDELFDYTSQKVMSETGQRPQQLLLLKRSTPYAIAPVYRSRLHIGSNVVGKIKVAVANFIWSRRKLKRRPLQLAVVDGPGHVFLEKKGSCWSQSLQFPKGGAAELTSRWIKIPCKRISRRSKGALFLNAETYQETEPIGLSFAFSGGYTHTLAPYLQQANWGGGIQARWAKAWGLGLHFSTGQPPNKGFFLSSTWLQPEFGWKWPFEIAQQQLEIFLGAYAQIGLAAQHKAELPTNFIFIAGGGANADLSWWFTRHLGLRIGAQAGIHYTPVLQNSGFFFQWRLRTALLIGF